MNEGKSINNIQKDSINVMHDVARFLYENTRNMYFNFKPNPDEMEFKSRGYKFKFSLTKEPGVYTLESITKL